MWSFVLCVEGVVHLLSYQADVDISQIARVFTDGYIFGDASRTATKSVQNLKKPGNSQESEVCAGVE